MKFFKLFILVMPTLMHPCFGVSALNAETPQESLTDIWVELKASYYY